MPLTTEVLIFDSSEAFRNDPTLFLPGLEMAMKTNGAHAPGYYGKQIDSPGTQGYAFVHWESYEAHAALINSPSYADLFQKLAPVLGGTRAPQMYHVEFSGPTVALDKPVTEVTLLTLKAPEHREALFGILSGFQEASKGLLVFGQTREDANKIIVISGWETVQAHLDVASKPEVAAALEQLRSLANEDQLYHAGLLQHRV